MTVPPPPAADTVGEVLRVYGVRTIAEARASLTAPDLADEVAIRSYRRAIKRWRSFLRLLAPLVGETTVGLNAEARGFARELSSARDCRAAIDALATCNGALSERTKSSLRQRLDALGAAAEAGVLTADTRARLLAGLDHAEAVATGWHFGRINAATLAARLAEGYRRARRAEPADWHEADAEALHDFRRRVIIHRYQMELMEPVWPKLARLWVDEAQRLRDRLGRFQDLAVLRQLTEPHQPLAPWRARLTPAIAERQQRERRAARNTAGRLFAERPDAFRRRLAALWRHHLS